MSDYVKPDEKVSADGDKTAKCQCGERKPVSELSPGYGGWTERSKPCYFCDNCIPF